MTFADDLFAARERLGWTQSELADELGVARKTVGLWERGAMVPSFDNLEKLEAVIGSRLNVEVPQTVPDLDDVIGEGPTKDEPPRVKKPAAGPRGKSTGGARKTKSNPGGLSLAAQLEFPYHLLGNVASSRGLPATSAALHGQAGPCAAAWDQFLMRYPALREKLESGMVAQDIVILIMAHMPIVQTAQGEMKARAEAMAGEGYTGGIGGEPAAA